MVVHPGSYWFILLGCQIAQPNSLGYWAEFQDPAAHPGFAAR